jgi:para-nitrobenzyl esterase
VRENIGRFGGDPSRVLVFGQSGGGGKISTLMGMPSAKGLFHRAVIQEVPVETIIQAGLRAQRNSSRCRQHPAAARG